ncbi:MAG: methylmalonyl Co-A mutase-associated GTPase MeaB [Bacteroidia bacterium]|nr:methylmalonyl Co-A mutase-associated GTPase MeaB [Bacteroidia bacterium]
MKMTTTELLKGLQEGDFRTIGRCLTLVENDLPGSKELLSSMTINSHTPIIGITGPPGAGKSSLVNAIIEVLTKQNKRVGIIAVDPTSPFNLGSILGDRVRMSEHFNNSNVYIRSVATRGSLGGLSAKIIEISDTLRASNFDLILVETVGVGQSEIEIVGLADVTVLVLVPEAGDEIQQLKSGVMEIADVFVVNKADRPGAEIYFNNLSNLLRVGASYKQKPEVVKTTATQKEGVEELVESLYKVLSKKNNQLKIFLLAEKAYKLIQNEKMKNINKQDLQQVLGNEIHKENFNLYAFVQTYIS